MYKKIKIDPPIIRNTGLQFPHCDHRILHAPGECSYCDLHKDWQDLRIYWGIAFTGWTPDENELPCPADHARGETHAKWPGNKAHPIKE